MPHYVGLDAGKNTTNICVVDERGGTVDERVAETSPRAIAVALRGTGRRYRRVGIEATSFTPWLYEGLAKAGFPVICIDARHARGILKAKLNKTDRNDAAGIAEMMRAGVHKAVHVKSGASRETKLLLTARRQIASKGRDLDNLLRSTLLQFGRKLEKGRLRTFEQRVEEASLDSDVARDVVETILAVRRQINVARQRMDEAVARLAAQDEVCLRLQQIPGVGPLTALSFKSAIDIPERFTRSRDVAVHLGLTPRAFRSGTIDRPGRISRFGDAATRSALFLSALSVLSPHTRSTGLKVWGQRIAARRGGKKAAVAVARKLAVIMHRMWLDSTDFHDAVA